MFSSLRLHSNAHTHLCLWTHRVWCAYILFCWRVCAWTWNIFGSAHRTCSSLLSHEESWAFSCLSLDIVGCGTWDKLGGRVWQVRPLCRAQDPLRRAFIAISFRRVCTWTWVNPRSLRNRFVVCSKFEITASQKVLLRDRPHWDAQTYLSKLFQCCKQPSCYSFS